MKTFLRSTFALAAGFALCASLASADAEACGGGFDFAPPVDHRIEGIARAEKAANEGKLASAAGSIVRMFPELTKAAMGRDKLVDRAFRTLALVTVRSGGVLPIDAEIPRQVRGTWAGVTEADRKANLEWAASSLRGLSSRTKDDPALQSDLGEALARLDGTQDEALSVLGGLADKDLLTSPEAYAALAALRAAKGDATGREAAVKRCEAMAKETRICAAPEASGKGQG